MTEIELKIKNQFNVYISKRILGKLEVIYNQLISYGLDEEKVLNHIKEITMVLHDEYSE